MAVPSHSLRLLASFRFFADSGNSCYFNHYIEVTLGEINIDVENPMVSESDLQMVAFHGFSLLVHIIFHVYSRVFLNEPPAVVRWEPLEAAGLPDPKALRPMRRHRARDVRLDEGREKR